jgi:hypothetical protein
MLVDPCRSLHCLGSGIKNRLLSQHKQPEMWSSKPSLSLKLIKLLSLKNMHWFAVGERGCDCWVPEAISET